MDGLVSAAEQFASGVEARTEYEELDQWIKDNVSRMKSNDEIKKLVLRDPDQAVRSLDPSRHTVTCAFVLSHALELLQKISPIVLDAIVEFLLNFDTIQGRYVSKKLETILSAVGTKNLFPPLITTELLTAAILRLDPSASTFTTTHLHLAKVAYAEGYTEQALPVLSRDITSFPMTGPVKAGVLLCDPETPASVYLSQPAWSADMRPDNVLEYNFLKGQIYTSRRDWEKAELAFQGAITHPVKEKGVSKISVDAYKRWLLVSLLQNGQESTLPSYTSPTVKSSCTSLAQPYVSIAKLFPTGAAAQLKAEAEASTTLWTEDGTMSLVTEVLAAYQKWRIISLRNVYSQISVHQLAKDTASADTGESLTDLAQVHALIQSMIDQGMLQGQLEADETGTAYLTFHDNQTLLTEEDFAREIARSHHTIQALAAEFKTVNERLSSNKEYVKHMAREEKRLAKEAENPSGGFETQIEEEDLMTGIVTNG